MGIALGLNIDYGGLQACQKERDAEVAKAVCEYAERLKAAEKKAEELQAFVESSAERTIRMEAEMDTIPADV